MTIDFNALGKRIARRRIELGLKQCVVAERAEISNNYLSNIENGKSIQSLQVISNLCIALSTTPDYLLLGTMHTNDIPNMIVDNLKLCDEETLKILNDIILCFINNKK